jgi:hypothetical protein
MRLPPRDEIYFATWAGILIGIFLCIALVAFGVFALHFPLGWTLLYVAIASLAAFILELAR